MELPLAAAFLMRPDLPPEVTSMLQLLTKVKAQPEDSQSLEQAAEGRGHGPPPGHLSWGQMMALLKSILLTLKVTALAWSIETVETQPSFLWQALASMIVTLEQQSDILSECLPSASSFPQAEGIEDISIALVQLTVPLLRQIVKDDSHASGLLQLLLQLMRRSTPSGFAVVALELVKQGIAASCFLFSHCFLSACSASQGVTLLVLMLFAN